MTKLKPCAWCGGEANRMPSGDVMCRSMCGAMRSIGIAYEAWQNRPAENQIKAEAVREALEYASSVRHDRVTGNIVGVSVKKIYDYLNSLEENR